MKKKRVKRIVDTSSTLPKVSGQFVPKALGAEKMTKEETSAFLRKAHGCVKKS